MMDIEQYLNHPNECKVYMALAIVQNDLIEAQRREIEMLKADNEALKAMNEFTQTVTNTKKATA